MRSFRTVTFLMILFMTLIGASTASAQLGQGALRFQVPFNFMVENTMFPTGEYRIRRMGITDPAHMLMIQGPYGKTIMFSTIPHESAYGYRDSAITLRRVDGLYYLSRIMIEGQFRGYEVPVSRYR